MKIGKKIPGQFFFPAFEVYKSVKFRNMSRNAHNDDNGKFDEQISLLVRDNTAQDLSPGIL